MKIQDLQKDWDAFGRSDPLWAIITDPSKLGRRWEPEDFFAMGVQEIDALMKEVAGLGLEFPRRRALDFGCGVGRLSQALASYFDEVHGVDVAPSMIEGAERFNRHGDRCRFHVNSVDSLALFAENYFYFIYSNITLQHIEPIYTKRYLAEFLRVLAPGGVLVFQLPHRPFSPFKQWVKHSLASTALSVFRRFGYLSRPIMVMNGIAHDEVIRLLECHGGKMIKVVDDPSAGRDWRSYRYFVAKPNHAGRGQL
jgi:SAM-dependent methyltransferase